MHVVYIVALVDKVVKLKSVCKLVQFLRRLLEQCSHNRDFTLGLRRGVNIKIINRGIVTWNIRSYKIQYFFLNKSYKIHKIIYK